MRQRSIDPWGMLALSFALCGCEPRSDSSPLGGAASAAPRFEDASARSGLAGFRHVCGGKDKDWVLEVNGSGLALFDYDLDGDLDVFFVNGSRLPPPYGEGAGAPPPSDALWRNLGGLRFEDATRQAGLTEDSWGCGVAVGDVDNDGDPDLFTANWGKDRLWLNNGDGTFRDATDAAGVGDPHWGSSACFLDFDRDGYLDLFIVNYLEFDPAQVRRRGSDPTCQYKGQPILCGPVGLPPAPNTLYRNRGAGAPGTFEDVSETSGIRRVDLKYATYGLGVCTLDFDRDGWLDLYVANDTRPNLLFRNLGTSAPGRFEELGMRCGVALNDDAVAQAGMGVDAVFQRGREREDIFVVNYEDDRNTYYRNDGDSGAGTFFSEVTSELGLAEPCFKHLGWGTFFFDAELDGDQDLFIAQGHVVPQADAIASSPGYRQLNKLFLNDGKGRYEDASARAGPGLEVKRSSRGAACGDLDGDGDLDIVVSEMDDSPTLLENAGAPASAWLALRCVGTRSNRDAIGAVVTLRAGELVQRRRIRSGGSYASESERLARFGLGRAASVEELRVEWPSGLVEVFAVPALRQVLTVTEGQGRAVR